MTTFYDQDWNVDHDKTTGCEGGDLAVYVHSAQKSLGFVRDLPFPETNIRTPENSLS